MYLHWPALTKWKVKKIIPVLLTGKVLNDNWKYNMRECNEERKGFYKYSVNSNLLFQSQLVETD